MTSRIFRNVGRVGTVTAALVAHALLLSAHPVGAQQPQPQVPPNTNPTERVIYPAEGQTPQQQLNDQFECYNWGTQQTAWDPHQAIAVLEEKHGAALKQAQESQGGAVRGAAGGALAGLAVGAIAGDAGEGAAIGAVVGGLTGGMRSRRQRQAAQSGFEQDYKAFQAQLQKWDRNYVACIQARKYVVN